MNRSHLGFASFLLLGVALTGLVGCRGTDKGTKRTTKATSEPSLSQLSKQAIETTDTAQVHELLHMFTPHTTSKAGTDEIQQVAQQQHDFLQKDIPLAGEEMEEAESLTFRKMDAHYLESCFLMRDAARQLEQATRDPDTGSNLTPLQLAHFAFGWVNRRVLPGAAYSANWQVLKSAAAWVPPHIVLRRGFGSPHDRALVFLELLRQFQLEGCLIDADHPLVGVVVGDELYLFDPAVGVPVADGKQGGIATLAMVRDNPALLKPLNIAPDDFARSEIVLNAPLSSLAPRMKVLEGLLNNNLPEGDRVSLFIDAARLKQNVTRVAEKKSKDRAIVGFSSSKTGRLAPTRMLHAFLPSDEGGRKAAGADPKKDPRQFQFEDCKSSSPYGLAQISYNLSKLGFDDRTKVYPDAFDFISRRAVDVVSLYCQQPREMLLRGQFTAMNKRLRRITELLENCPSLSDPDFQQDIREWVKAMPFYVRNKNLGAFWAQDQLFAALLNVETDLDLRNFEKNIGDDKEMEKDKEKQQSQEYQPLKKVRPNMLTYVELSGCCRTLVDPQVRFLLVQHVLEKAAATQARHDSLKASALALKNDRADAGRISDAEARTDKAFVQAEVDWNNVRFELAGLKLKLDFGADQVKKNVKEMRQPLLSDYANLEALQRAWSVSCFARLQWIEAMEHVPEHQQKLKSELMKLDSELQQLAADEEFQSSLRIFEGHPAQKAFLQEFRAPGLNRLLRQVALHKQWLQN